VVGVLFFLLFFCEGCLVCLFVGVNKASQEGTPLVRILRKVTNIPTRAQLGQCP
jgi:hypothetical protein